MRIVNQNFNVVNVQTFSTKTFDFKPSGKWKKLN